MTYSETIEYLYSATPVFQHQGGSAYKPGLDTVKTLDEANGHPHKSFRSIHVAGTNGKGSTCHTIAAVLQAAGYKVGLFTSPHLIDFRERIRVNGEMIPQDYVVSFVDRSMPWVEKLKPSFFELTTMMAFCYFRDAGVDYAIIEVGMGGRLDSTNIITPILSIITNISLDHTQFLGSTEEAIAHEKAGIIKSGVPSVIGEACGVVKEVFASKAKDVGSPVSFAENESVILSYERLPDGFFLYDTADYGDVLGELAGEVQCLNARTILTALRVLCKQNNHIFDARAVRQGFAHVNEMTGLMGRWQKLHDTPLVICDTGHNVGGFEKIAIQLQQLQSARKGSILHMVIGFVSDKDIDGLLNLIPQSAVCYFTQPDIKRALDAEALKQKATPKKLHGQSYSTVVDAYQCAMAEAKDNDIIFIGGSNFIVSEIINHLFNSDQK